MKKLIFDFGFYTGEDTELYLSLDFFVVAVEPNIKFVTNGIKRFNEDIENKRLEIINKAVYDEIGTTDFYINTICSCEKWLAEIDNTKAKLVEVETTTLTELCKKYGTPHYLKVDIEGCGGMVAKQIYNLDEKPRFVSFETLWKTFAEVFAWLYLAGYRKFQLVNQLNNSEYSSGLFGEYLPEDKWITYEEMLDRYMKFRNLRMLDKKELSLGWLDVHASL